MLSFISKHKFEAHLAALDREDSQLARQIADVTVQLGELNRRLAALEKRFDQLDSGQTEDVPADDVSSEDAAG